MGGFARKDLLVESSGLDEHVVGESSTTEAERPKSRRGRWRSGLCDENVGRKRERRRGQCSESESAMKCVDKQDTTERPLSGTIEKEVDKKRRREEKGKMEKFQL